MTSPRFKLIALALLTLVTLSSASFAYTFTTIRASDYVPSAGWTSVRGINDKGDIVGNYEDPAGAFQFFAFVLDKHGTFTTIQASDYIPGAGLTIAYGINNAGVIVGSYQGPDAITNGFILEKGTFTPIFAADYVPDAWYTAIYGVNNAGAVVGIYYDSSLDCPPCGNKLHGFLLDKGTFTTIDSPIGYYTILYGINASGQIVGGGGFLLDDGVFTYIQSPTGAPIQTYGINASGTIVGEHDDGSGSGYVVGYIASK